MTYESATAELKSYRVWDAPTRWFHWINVLSVLTLAGLGLMILNAGSFEIPSAGKILLKTLHVWTGYV
ncbi:MAG: cytochrome b/b6 domain-containing protein, partial [Xanthomonadales bacterium]|nr:cytochrome b/b6 domain-containing protein [Xanthomonadales bacterium]